VIEPLRYVLERVDDVAVVQLYASGFEKLPLREKILIWHLYLAALAGRDIYYDQRYVHSLEMRSVLEAVVVHGRDVELKVLAEIRRYTKLFWINSGPYNNVTARKFLLALSIDELMKAVRAAVRAGAVLPLADGETVEALIERLAPCFFDPQVDPVLTSKTPGDEHDILRSSANNLYCDVAMSDLVGFDERYGLNSRLVRRDGRLVEEVYRVGGKYDREIRHIVAHLENARPYATAEMSKALDALIRFYRTGEERDRIAYDVEWVHDQASPVDTINGFVEVYLDSRGTKGAWEALVYFVNPEKTRQIETLAAHAQWFEDEMPWDQRFRKTAVRGVTAKAIEVVIETGDSGPVTAIGINLPNDQAIREQHGSKSVSLSNVSDAYEHATPEGLRTEFSWTAEEAARASRWGAFAQELTTNMHEVIGHGSGRMAAGVTAPPHVLLKEQFSALEESRADLVALYFLPDPELVRLGLVPAEHHAEVVRAEFEHYTRTALVQLRRMRSGTHLEEDHMRNRQMIVNWLRAHTSAIKQRRRDGKTYYVMVDAAAFREGVGRLLSDVQRIKGEGDYEAAKVLFDTYGIHFDPHLRDEVVARVDALDLPSHTAFVMPRLESRYDNRGEIVDVEMSYPCDLETQMLEYSAFAAGSVSVNEPSGATSDVLHPSSRPL
jgi:dipeptidyl-peptidase-3